MATKAETISKELLVKYKKEKIRVHLIDEKKPAEEKNVDEFFKKNSNDSEIMKNITGYVLTEYTDSYDFSVFSQLITEAKKRRVSKALHITEMEKVNDEKIVTYVFGVSLDEKKKGKIKYTDKTGLFKVSFSDGSFLYYAKWIVGSGKNRTVEGMFAGEEIVWFNFLTLMKKETKKRAKPKFGVYRIYSSNMSNGELIYDKKKDLQKTPIVHPIVERLQKDMDYYFQNVDVFTRYGMAGVRKALLVGPPGTGKTSLCVRVSERHADKKCIVFSTQIGDVAKHLYKCAKYKVSTIVMLEDAESTLGNANSAVLNFLDGIDQPTNKEGAYVIMTTNFPEKIEPRIKKRKGRIDVVFPFGGLNGAYALECAEIYFKDIFFNKKNSKTSKIGKEQRRKLAPIVDGMTGADIKELAQASMIFAVSSEREVSIAIIQEVKDAMKDDLTEIDKYAAEVGMAAQDSLGFEFGVNNQKEVKEETPLIYH